MEHVQLTDGTAHIVIYFNSTTAKASKLKQLEKLSLVFRKKNIYSALEVPLTCSRAGMLKSGVGGSSKPETR